MSMKTIKLVTFDVTRTLLQFRIPPGSRYAEIATSYGISVDSTRVSKKFKSSYQQTSQVYPNFGKNTVGWEQWWTLVIKKTFEDDVNDKRALDSLATNLIQLYRTGNEWILCEGCEGVLNILKRTGIKIGVISNFDQRLGDILKNACIDRYFDFIVGSYDADCMKPDSKIFQQALTASKLSGIVSKECLHIGDDIKNDYVGATSAGWNAILVSNKPSQNEKIDRNHVFNSLNDLCEFFMKNENIFIK
ncbi:rhythmically expressed gene 2 protein-like [Arctopsyche grandis]|uniref:rhythmically expressed gene 2 protein-like n=1 Tax=Arctopsyche grandis TaxID=121162 RepID=UPI00406D9529